MPEEAVSCTVSLDGVPLRPDGDREACWREASCGTVSFHDADGNRLRTVSFARMPEAGKATLKAQLAAEVAHVRKVRPDLPLVAVADAAPDNWTFLEELQPDERAVDFFHATLLRLPTTRSRPTGTTGTELSCATTKGASTRSSGRFAISAARRPALKIPRACVLPQEQRRATRASRPRATRSGRASWRLPTRCWSTSA